MSQGFETDNMPIIGLIKKLLASALFARVKSINAADIVLQKVIGTVQKDVDYGTSFSLAELLLFSDILAGASKFRAEAGSVVVAYNSNTVSDERLASKLYRHSVSGLHSLFSLGGGLALNVTALGDKLSTLCAQRYVVLPEKKADKLISAMNKNKTFNCVIGSVTAEECISFIGDGGVVFSASKNELFPAYEIDSVLLNESNFAEFREGYNAICSVALCDRVSENNVLSFGYSTRIEALCSRVLGIYAAVGDLRIAIPRIIFDDNPAVQVAPSRPAVADGDYVYYLKLKNDFNGLSDLIHLRQLLYYLSEMKKYGIIRSILPYREDISRLLPRIADDSLEYVQLNEPDLSHFGVFVTVSRGESVNGAKIGYYKLK